MAGRPPDDPAIVDSTAALASLYQAPLGEFVARRHALVAQLKRSGHKDVAARLGSAAKPSRAAFLVNQVFWRARSVYDAVLEAGTAARSAQQARLLGDTEYDLGETMQARDAAVRAAVARAARVAEEDGQPASEATLGQVRASFEALAAHGLEGRLPHGHLTADVELPGLAALAGLTLPATAAPGPVRRFEVVARRAEPVAPAEPAAPPVDPRIAELEATVGALREREAASVERLAELERGLAGAADVLARAEAAAADAARQVEAARQAVARGTQARDAAGAEAARLANERAAAEQDLAALSTPVEPPPETTRGTRVRKRSATKAPTSANPAPALRRPRR